MMCIYIYIWAPDDSVAPHICMDMYRASNTCMAMYGASDVCMNIYGAYNLCIDVWRASNKCMHIYGARDTPALCQKLRIGQTSTVAYNEAVGIGLGPTLRLATQSYNQSMWPL